MLLRFRRNRGGRALSPGRGRHQPRARRVGAVSSAWCSWAVSLEAQASEPEVLDADVTRCPNFRRRRGRGLRGRHQARGSATGISVPSGGWVSVFGHPTTASSCLRTRGRFIQEDAAPESVEAIHDWLEAGGAHLAQGGSATRTSFDGRRADQDGDGLIAPVPVSWC